MIGDFFTFLVGGVFDFLSGMFGILPQMPIGTDDLTAITGNEILTTGLAWANYFLPLGWAASTVALWATGMMAYLGIKLAIKYSGEIL